MDLSHVVFVAGSHFLVLVINLVMVVVAGWYGVSDRERAILRDGGGCRGDQEGGRQQESKSLDVERRLHLGLWQRVGLLELT